MRSLTLLGLCLLSSLLAGCGETDNTGSAAPNERSAAALPVLTTAEVGQLSAQGRADLERRCMGLNHPTCLELRRQPMKAAARFGPQAH